MGIFNFLFTPNMQKLKEKKDVNGLIKALRYQNDWFIRSKAAEVLGEIGDKRAVEPLILTLKDTDQSVRSKVVEALGKVRDKRAVEPLILILKDKSRDVRSKAVEALGKIGEPAVEPLILALKDKSRDVRDNAVEALGEIGDARAVEPLALSLKDMLHLPIKEVEALGKMGKPAVEPLILALGISCVRSKVAEILGNIGDKRAVEPLILILKDKSRDVRCKAAEALEKIGFQPVEELDRVYYLLDKKEWDKVIAIGSAVVDPLIIALKDYYELRCSAATILGKIRDPRAVEPLILALQDTNSDLQSKAVWALGEIGDPRAVAPLILALKDQSSYEDGRDFQSSVIEALGKIGKSAVDPLILAFKEEKVYWAYAVEVLGKIGDPKAVDPLIQFLESDFVRRAGDYKDINHAQRIVVEALGRIGDPKAVDPLIQSLKSSRQYWNQIDIVDALRNIGDPRAIDPLIQLKASVNSYEYPDLANSLNKCINKLKDKVKQEALKKQEEIIHIPVKDVKEERKQEEDVDKKIQEEVKKVEEAKRIEELTRKAEEEAKKHALRLKWLTEDEALTKQEEKRIQVKDQATGLSIGEIENIKKN